MIWDARPISEALMAVLPLIVVVMAAALVPSRHEPDSPFLASQGWRYRHVIIVLAVITGIQFVSPYGVTKAAEMWPWAIDNGSTALFIMASVWGVVRWKHRRPWRALGFDPTTAFDHILWSLRIGLGVVSVLTLLVLVVRIGTADVRNSPFAPSRAMFHDQLGSFMAVILVTAVLGPVAEELFFRGVAYGPLLRKFGTLGATVGSAVLWASAHYSGVSLSSAVKVSFTLLVGIVYAEVYRRRESLVPTVTFHIIGNATAMFIRDPHLATLVPLSVVSVSLWVVSIVLFHVCKRKDFKATLGRTPQSPPWR